MRLCVVACIVWLHSSCSAFSPSTLLFWAPTSSSHSRFRPGLVSLRMSQSFSSPSVSLLQRFAVKGMSADTLNTVSLGIGEAFPFDRQWALLRGEKAASVAFNPQDPQWIHKENFFCAFSAGEALARLATRFDADRGVLEVRLKEQQDIAPMEFEMSQADEVARLERFLSSELFGGAEVQVVTAAKKDAQAHTHQFGNTASGVKHNQDTRTIHILNANTVRQVGEAIGEELAVERFRGNVVVDGLPPWSEFDWVGRGHVRVGGARLAVIKRTVRCAGINVGGGAEGRVLDLPQLLAQHFPQHGPFLGVYAQVVGAGSMSVGDAVEWQEEAWGAEG